MKKKSSANPARNRSPLAGALRTDLDLQKANFHMTEQRIVLGEPPESTKEMIRQMLEKK